MRLLLTAGCLAFVAYLIWRDVKKRDDAISWAPLVWMFLAGSRWVSSWLNLGSPISSVNSYSEGSPVDRLVFLSIIVWGVVVLARRQIDWGRLLSSNVWIVAYFLFCLSSILWADSSVVLVKRWVKDLGNPVMALVLLTERRPYEAVGITLRRLSYLLLPLSVLFVRYYPELGRAYKPDGSPMYTGVGHQKNDLGAMCLIAGMYYFWKLLQKRNGTNAAEPFDSVDLVMVAMLLYLLRMSDSQTATACLVMTICLMLLSRVRFVASSPGRIVPIVAVSGVTFWALDSTFRLKDQILEMLGRDPTLTNRVELWDLVLSHAQSPLVGAGFMSFWAGERMQAVWDEMGDGVNQAHNGYLEQYLNLGYVGVGFIVVLMLIGVWKAWRALSREPSEGMLRLCLLVTAAFYNYTEASFYGINNMWVLLLVASFDVSRLTASAADPIRQPALPLRVTAAPRRPAAAAPRLRASAPDRRWTNRDGQRDFRRR